VQPGGARVAEGARRRRRPEIVAVVNQKGGTGKTTTVLNLGSALARLGRRVLLVDLDPQANLTYSLGIVPGGGTVADVLRGERGFDEILVEQEGMAVAPGSRALADVEVALASEAGRERVLRERLAAARDYDVVLLDCPPSLSVLTLNALEAADTVLIPVQLEVLALQGLTQLLDTVRDVRRVLNRRLRVKGIVPVMVDVRRSLSGEILSAIEHNVDERVFETVIRENVRVAEAPSFARSVLAYAPASNGARDYTALAQEFIEAP
jgi:chromosome partitioning protein